MSKKSPPKTAFSQVTTAVTGAPDEPSADGADVAVTSAVVVEATSWSEAAAYIADRHITVEVYPVDKLVAYIKAGGEPIKVPAKTKRPYAKKVAAKTVTAAPVQEPQPA